MQHGVLLSLPVFPAYTVRWLQQFYARDEVGAEKRVMEIDPDFHACLQVGGKYLGRIMPKFGPLRINETADRATILGEDDPTGGMIHLLDLA